MARHFEKEYRFNVRWNKKNFDIMQEPWINDLLKNQNYL
jgi:hypothetical protein